MSASGRQLRPLLLCGGPAVGKSTCGRILAGERDRGVFIDGDDIRQLVVAGAAVLWDGPEGKRQHDLGAANAARLASGFHTAGFDVVIADYVTPSSLTACRSHLPDCFVVYLRLSLTSALERASTRTVYLTDQEFELLHELLDSPPAADLTLEVEGMTQQDQAAALRAAWEEA